MIAHFKHWLERHRSFLIVLFLFANFRLLALVLLRPGGFITHYSEFDFYYAWGQLTSAGYQPFENTWSVYPPLIPVLMFPAFEAASRIPPWVEPKLIFTFILGLELILFDIGNLLVLYRLASRLETDKETGRQADKQNTASIHSHPVTLSSGHTVILYALLFAPLQTMLGFYDGVALFFLLVALDLLTARQQWGWIASALAVALGFLTKLTPIILIPVAIRWLWSIHAIRNPQHARWIRPLLYVLITAGSVILIGYRLIRGNLELGLSSLRIQNIRPPWQSIWALIDGYYSFGLVPIDMRNLEGFRTYQWATQIPWLWVTIGFGVAYLWLYTRRFDWAKVRTVYSFTALSVIGLLVYSKGWSPQFLVWVVAFVVLLLPTIRGISIVVLLTLINVVESFVYLILLPDQTWILFGTVIARTILLLLLAVDFLALIWPREATAQTLQRLSSVASWTAIAVTLLAGIISTPRAVNAYWDRRLAEHPCPGVVEILEQEAIWPNHTIVTNRVENWHQLYPWLRDQYRFIVLDRYGIADGQPPGAVDEEMRRLFASSVPDGEFWYVARGPDDILNIDLPTTILTGTTLYELVDLENREVSQWNSESTWRHCVLMRLFKSKSDLTTRIVDPTKPIGLIDGTIRLLDVETDLASPGEPFRVVLYWQEWLPVQESYTVFAQLIDPSGVVVSQKDNLPVQGLAPTNTWNSPVIRDPYALPVPADAPAGTYQLHVGMYDSTVTRLPITLADGSIVDHFTFTVEIAK